MSDVKKNMERVRWLARSAATSEWLKAQYERLERQATVLHALGAARESLWESNETELGELARLQTAAARMAIATCDSIMRHSGYDEADDDGEAAIEKRGDDDAREETLPW